MEIKEYITAEWARSTASSVLGPRLEEELTDILDIIEQTVGDNYFSFKYPFDIDARVKSNLESRGFEVITTVNDEEISHFIKW